jgi:hypothetical protein
MRILVPFISVAVLAACQPPVPDSAVGGVGFESYSDFQQRRETELNSNARPAIAQSPVTNVPYPTEGAAPLNGQQITSGPITSAPIGSIPQGGVAAQSTYPQTTYPQPAAPVATAPVDNAGISDEQDFSAVASRESIASDKQRIAQNKAQYQQVQPTALPQRSGQTDTSLIEYAISAPNRRGEAIYGRSGSSARSQRACARYDTPEDAQTAFLKAGGPTRDPKNLDPDGDGFACFWDPTPFQKARG